MFADTFLLSFLHMPWSSHSCNDQGIHILQEIFAVDMLTVLKPFLEHDRKHVKPTRKDVQPTRNSSRVSI